MKLLSIFDIKFKVYIYKVYIFFIFRLISCFSFSLYSDNSSKEDEQNICAAADLQGLTRGEWNWPKSYLKDSETQEREI